MSIFAQTIYYPRRFPAHTLQYSNNPLLILNLVTAGPSTTCRFYLKNVGEKVPELPLFHEPGVSTVNTDNIPGLEYPLEDWSTWRTFLENSGLPVKNQESHLRWPLECTDFCTRPSYSGWPSLALRNKVMRAGCHLVPRAPRHIGEKGPKTWQEFHHKRKLEVQAWRISFSLSENMVTTSFTGPQRRIFLLLKMLFSTSAKKLKQDQIEDGKEDNFKKYKFSSFLLKHTMFWSMESIKQTEWRYNNLHSCIQHVLDTLQQFLDQMNIPHFFFGQGKNLLEGDIPMGEHAYSEIGKFELKESRRILTERCQSLKKVVGLLKTQDTFLQLIRYAGLSVELKVKSLC